MTQTLDAVLAPDSAQVFYDGFLSPIRLDHPEGVAVDPSDGSIWCGGEAGQLYQIAADGSDLAVRMEHEGGLTLAVSFGPDGLVYYVDLGNRSVHRFDPKTGRADTFVHGSIGGYELRIPNAIAFDRSGTMYLTDSHAFDKEGPGILRIGPDGTGELWCAGPFGFANGVAVAPDNSAVYVAESTANCITRVPIRSDGSAGNPDRYIDLEDAMPDGLCFGPDDRLYVACYTPSQILRIESDRAVLLIRDETVHTLAHPTNIAFRGNTMFTANLGRWHVTKVDTDLG